MRRDLVVGMVVADQAFDWEALCDEYQSVRCGRLWRALVVQVCTRIVSKYPPNIYNDWIAWDSSSIDDIAQDVIVNRLLIDGQIDYIVMAASNVNAACGLIGMHVKQLLAQRAAPSQRENVAVRLFAVLEQLGEVVISPGGNAYRPRGSSWRAGELTEQALARAARVIANLPRLPNRGTDRLSPLFTTEVLNAAAEPLWQACAIPLSLNSLRTILDRALTGLTPTLFQLNEDHDLPAISDLSAEESVLVNDLAERLMALLSDEQREILVNIEFMNDTELAELLGVSRPTALKRRHLTRDIVGGFFDHPDLRDLTDHQRGAVLVRAQSMLGGRRSA